MTKQIWEFYIKLIQLTSFLYYVCSVNSEHKLYSCGIYCPNYGLLLISCFSFCFLTVEETNPKNKGSDNGFVYQSQAGCGPPDPCDLTKPKVEKRVSAVFPRINALQAATLQAAPSWISARQPSVSSEKPQEDEWTPTLVGEGEAWRKVHRPRLGRVQSSATGSSVVPFGILALIHSMLCRNSWKASLLLF